MSDPPRESDFNTYDSETMASQENVEPTGYAVDNIEDINESNESNLPSPTIAQQLIRFAENETQAESESPMDAIDDFQFEFMGSNDTENSNLPEVEPPASRLSRPDLIAEVAAVLNDYEPSRRDDGWLAPLLSDTEETTSDEEMPSLEPDGARPFRIEIRDSDDNSDDNYELARADAMRWYFNIRNSRNRPTISAADQPPTSMAPTLPNPSFIQRLRRAVFSLDSSRQHIPVGGESQMEVEVPNNDQQLDNTGPVNGEQQLNREEMPVNAVRFDTNLPAEHNYLGVDMNRVSGVNYLEVGSETRVLMFMHQHILFPGEVLPFMIDKSVVELDADNPNGILFGVCFPFLRANGKEEYIYGVTCQIYEKGVGERGFCAVKSRALQRFITRSIDLNRSLEFVASQPTMKCYGIIKILPEIYLPEPLKCINMGSMCRFRENSSMTNIYKRYQMSTTPWPSCVYDYYSISTIIEKARTQLVQHKIDTMPSDPTQLSFWLVRNLHISEDMMSKIFMTDSVNMRMKLISNTFKEDAIFICRFCSNRIANCCELFAMSKHGVQTQYCNPSGYIHETNTVYDVLHEAVVYTGDLPSSEYSWFPGYQWLVINCKVCTRHMGWEFKALEPNLVPKKFFGISSSSVRVSAPIYLPSDPRAVIYRHLMRLTRPRPTQ